MKFNSAYFFFVIILMASIVVPPPARGALLYKSYVVKRDRGREILCDPYIVQKNDWVLKLFKKKGEISQKDFPEFLRIFERINPHIADINRISPGQHILIPLKKLTRDALPGQSTGIVTLPFVTISDVPDILKSYSTDYTVKRGDFVSRIIAKRYGTYGSRSYREGVQLFKILNPDVTNLNRIYTGQKLRLPDPRLRKQPWYRSLFDSSGKMNIGLVLKDLKRTDKAASGAFVPKAKSKKERPKNPISKAASILNAKLLTKGIYYFPRKGKEDLEIDLSRFPVIELKEGIRILVSRGKPIGKSDLKLIKSFWKNVDVVSLATDAPEEKVFDSVFNAIGKDPEKNRLSFSDNGLKVEVRARWIIKKPSFTRNRKRHICIMLINNQDEHTPESISHYLKQHGIIIKDIRLGKKKTGKKARRSDDQRSDDRITGDPLKTVSTLNRRIFIKDLATTLGYKFAQNISITFPYAGIQVKAVSNLISLKDGNLLLVDFGDFFGDAIQAIRKTGLDIIQLKARDDIRNIIQKLLRAINNTYSTDPTFFAAKRSVFNNISLTIPGFLVSNPGTSKLLLSAVPLHDEIIHFLNKQKINIIRISS